MNSFASRCSESSSERGIQTATYFVFFWNTVSLLSPSLFLLLLTLEVRATALVVYFYASFKIRSLRRKKSWARSTVPRSNMIQSSSFFAGSITAGTTMSSASLSQPHSTYQFFFLQPWKRQDRVISSLPVLIPTYILYTALYIICLALCNYFVRKYDFFCFLPFGCFRMNLFYWLSLSPIIFFLRSVVIFLVLGFSGSNIWLGWQSGAGIKVN